MTTVNNGVTKVEPMEEDVNSTPPAEERSDDYAKLLEHGLNEEVANKLDQVFKTGKLTYSDLDERAFLALKEFKVEGAVAVLAQFVEQKLEHVSNKSAFLCGMMKTYTQKLKSDNAGTIDTTPKGPDEQKIKAILDRTGYTLDVTTGQRKYGGPPPNWDGPEPPAGSELYVGRIPKDVFEDDLILLFEKSGVIYDMRLMMDPMTGSNRGFAFVTYTTPQEAQQAHKDLENYEIRPGRKLKCNISIPNVRLFVGNIPKSRSKDEIKAEFCKLTAGLNNVIIYSSADDKKKNRGFCFLEYDSHKSASAAKKKLSSRPTRVWNCDIIVDWADPQEEPDSETMSKVKVLYVRNLKVDCTEEKIKEIFEQYGSIQKVKKLKDYAFVHFDERDGAMSAMQALNGKDVGGTVLDVSLAKPPSDKKKKEEMLRARERRMMQLMQERGTGYMQPPGRMGGPMRPRGPHSSMMAAGDYDYYESYGRDDGSYEYYDDYGYDDYYEYVMPRPRVMRPRQGPGIGRGMSPRGMLGRGMGPRGGATPRAYAGMPRGPRMMKGPHSMLPNKRKLEPGTGVQVENKRRFSSTWGGMGRGGYRSENNGSSYGDQQWYSDSYNSTWQ